jgi:hypothetical protein
MRVILAFARRSPFDTLEQCVGRHSSCPVQIFRRSRSTVNLQTVHLTSLPTDGSFTFDNFGISQNGKICVAMIFS